MSTDLLETCGGFK